MIVGIGGNGNDPPKHIAPDFGSTKLLKWIRWRSNIIFGTPYFWIRNKYRSIKLKRHVRPKKRGPWNQFLKILNMRFRSLKKHEMVYCPPHPPTKNLPIPLLSLILTRPILVEGWGIHWNQNKRFKTSKFRSFKVSNLKCLTASKLQFFKISKFRSVKLNACHVLFIDIDPISKISQIYWTDIREDLSASIVFKMLNLSDVWACWYFQK